MLLRPDVLGGGGGGRAAFVRSNAGVPADLIGRLIFSVTYAMRFEMQLPTLPVGRALASARFGEFIPVETEGFLSSEDGDALHTFLDEISGTFLARVPEERRPDEASVRHLLAVVHQDGKCVVHVNELEFTAQVRARERVDAGSPVLAHQVADVVRFEPEGVELPDDVGFVLVFSLGWRRAAYFDYRPLASRGPILRDPGARLGPLFGYLLFLQRLKLDDVTWSAFMNSDWFPFIGLADGTVSTMIRHAQSGWDLAELVPRAKEDARQAIRQVREVVADHPVFREHTATVAAALRHFEAGDYLTAASMLYPRIEGILRSHHALTSPGTAPRRSRDLAEAIAPDADEDNGVPRLLLPQRFRQYLNKRFFAGFDPITPSGVSRNTVAHGVAPEAELDMKAATIAVLTLHQLAFLIPKTTIDGASEVNPDGSVPR